mmetsp:Transcript_81633/g.228969  ORF Transcript_81633/g.228969 Transcript_81633/m.228969 type:complete len:335 (-) Transcript_81633:357-1361(-)
MLPVGHEAPEGLVHEPPWRGSEARLRSEAIRRRGLRGPGRGPDRPGRRSASSPIACGDAGGAVAAPGVAVPGAGVAVCQDDGRLDGAARCEGHAAEGRRDLGLRHLGHLPRGAGERPRGDGSVSARDVPRRPRGRGEASRGARGGRDEVPGASGPVPRRVHGPLRRGRLLLRGRSAAGPAPRAGDERGRKPDAPVHALRGRPREGQGARALRRSGEVRGQRRGLQARQRALSEGLLLRRHREGHRQAQGPGGRGRGPAGEGAEDLRRLPHGPHAAGCREARPRFGRGPAEDALAEMRSLHERNRLAGAPRHTCEGHRAAPEAAVDESSALGSVM